MGQENLWEKRGQVPILTCNRPDGMKVQTLEMTKLQAQNLQEFTSWQE